MKVFRLIVMIFIVCSTHSARASTCFNDQNLAQITSTRLNQRPVLIYVWSPRMVYSVQNMAVASGAAAAAGMDFVVLHDSRVPEHEWRQAWPESAALCAQQLIQLQALRHFPTAFVVTTKGVHALPIVGAMPPSFWQLSIAQRLQP